MTCGATFDMRNTPTTATANRACNKVEQGEGGDDCVSFLNLINGGRAQEIELILLQI
jgi:hypothetical protein